MPLSGDRVERPGDRAGWIERDGAYKGMAHMLYKAARRLSIPLVAIFVLAGCGEEPAEPEPGAAPEVTGDPAAGRQAVELVAGGQRLIIENLSVGAAAPGDDQPPEDRRLVEAAEAGDAGVVTTRLADGAPVDALDGLFGWAALHYAANSSHADIVAILLDAGADPDMASRFDETALDLAASAGAQDVVDLLIAAGADIHRDTIGWTALHAAAARGEVGVIGRLLGAGALVDARNSIGETPLIEAAANGRTAAVEAFLAAGADIDFQSDVGETALMQAARHDRGILVEALLAAGADPDLETVYRQTALDLARLEGLERIVEMLRAAGAAR